MNPQEQARAALRVLAGHQTPEQAAEEHGVPVSEVEAWCRLLKAGSSLAAKRRRLSVIGLTAGALLLVGVTVAVAGPTPCPSPSLPLPASLKKFCPDVPASAVDISSNFSQAVKWVETKVGPVGQPLPDGWIKGSMIASGQITTGLVSLNAVNNTSQVKDNDLNGNDLTAASGKTLDSTSFVPGALVQLYKVNPNCKSDSGYSDSPTCHPNECNPCGAGNTGTTFASCTQGCLSPSSCVMSVCDTKANFCDKYATPVTPCNNTPAGFLLAPLRIPMNSQQDFEDRARPGACWRPVALGGLGALAVVLCWVRAAVAAGCTPSPLLAPLIDICPETPALAGAVNNNFAQLGGALRTKFSTKDPNSAPGVWVYSKTIGASEITSSHLAPDAIASDLQIAPGGISGDDFAASSIKIARLSNAALYKRNLACAKTSLLYSASATCAASPSSMPGCPAGQSFYTACDSSVPAPGCMATAPLCNNTLLGSFITP